MTIIAKTALLTEDEFIARFDPEQDEEGSYYKQRDWCDDRDKIAIDAARAKGRVWTAVNDDDGNWCLASGYHWVNRLYYVICKNPVQDDEEFEVMGDAGWEKESANKLAEYVWDSTSEGACYQEFVANGGDPKDHVLWHAANILGTLNELRTR